MFDNLSYHSKDAGELWAQFVTDRPNRIAELAQPHTTQMPEMNTVCNQ